MLTLAAATSARMLYVMLPTVPKAAASSQKSVLEELKAEGAHLRLQSCAMRSEFMSLALMDSSFGAGAKTTKLSCSQSCQKRACKSLAIGLSDQKGSGTRSRTSGSNSISVPHSLKVKSLDHPPDSGCCEAGGTQGTRLVVPPQPCHRSKCVSVRNVLLSFFGKSQTPLLYQHGHYLQQTYSSPNLASTPKEPADKNETRLKGHRSYYHCHGH